MEKVLFLTAVVIFVCIAFQKLLGKTGVPGLFIFILLGMLFGSDGLLKIDFDDYSFANRICSVALIFIMFYGGAGTKWKTAKPAAVQALLLSSAGTVLTAGMVGAFCTFILDFSPVEAFLMGAVICSTDAASVFSILRSKRMNLKYATAPLLEVESGSNDPFSYMLTVVFLSLMSGENYTGADLLLLLAGQVIIGSAGGILFAVLSRYILRKVNIAEMGLDTTFLVGVALVSYAVPYFLGGNGYLSVYIAGIILGNTRLPNKKHIIDFLGGLTTLMQMFLFFLLGLLAFPSRLPAVSGTALAIALFLTFVARPLAVSAVLTPFKSCIPRQIFVAWSGMRGAASIVFAIMAVTGSAALSHDIFHIVFFIVLFSILVQGALLPEVARRLDMMDADADVLKTFSDYTDNVPVQFLRLTLHAGHPWDKKRLAEIDLPPESLLVLVLRGKEKMVPKGDTVLAAGDVLILGGREGGEVSGIHLYERTLSAEDERVGKRIAELSFYENLVILILRNEHVIIPNGDTVLLTEDILVMGDR